MMQSHPCPRVSFGIPVYNEEASIRRCLDSILAQDFADFEVVVCDNASTDRTREIVEGCSALDSRVRVFTNETNVGLIQNFNRVFDLARGEFFRWVGADDWLEPDYTSRCVAALDGDPGAIVATSGFALHDANGVVRAERFAGERIESENPVRRFERMLWFLHAGGDKYEPLYSLMRREALARTGRIRAIPYNDYVLVAELSLAGRFVHVPKLLFHRCLRTPTDRKVVLERLMPSSRWKLGGAFLAMARTLLAVVREASLSPGQRARCYAVVFRFFLREAWAVCQVEIAGFRRNQLGMTRARLRRLFGVRG